VLDTDVVVAPFGAIVERRVNFYLRRWTGA